MARKSQAELDLEARAKLFKALGNATRLLILNLIRQTPRHTEELASILDLSAGTVSHHLHRLAEVGLLVSEKDQYYQNYKLVDGIFERTFGEVIAMAPPEVAADAAPDAYRRKVHAIFFQHGRLKQIPTQHKKRRIVLEEIVQVFEVDRDYPEREVNLLLSEVHDDFATLRRELVDGGLLTREAGVYRRPLPEPDAKPRS